MPDILIRGMEMPTTCFECPFMYSRRYCSANHKLEFSDEKYSELKERHLDCPLHELPPHGDLIDRDAIVNAEKTKPIAKLMLFGGKYVIDLDDVRDAPVIVPAEKGE